MAPPAATAAARTPRARGRASAARKGAKPKRKRGGPRRFARPALLALALLAALAGAYQFWLRNSSLVAVENVRVEGATVNAAEVRAALEGAASEMTTLNVDGAALNAAVADYPTVGSLSVERDFPHGLTIAVHEVEPVAVVGDGPDAVAVDRRGTVLTGVPAGDLKLATVDAKVPANGRLEGGAREQAAVLGAAPAPLRPAIERSSTTREGIEITLRGGIELRFGEASDADAKWRAAAAVLADPKLTALTYIDLRVPDRPAVGGDPRASVPVEDPTLTEPSVP